jgi:hypothetical protein
MSRNVHGYLYSKIGIVSCWKIEMMLSLIRIEENMVEDLENDS